MIQKVEKRFNKIKHYDLLKLVLDGQDILQCLKIKDLENENRLENLKELLRAMEDYDNLQSFWNMLR